MKIETKQVNITAVHAEDVLSLAQTKVSEIRAKIIELWDDAPIVTQFPELIALIVPKEQVSITIQNRVITVANQDIKSFDTRNIEKFLQLVRAITEILPKPIVAYGYNYNFLVQTESENTDDAKKILNDIINFDNLSIEKENVLGSGLNLSYLDGDIRHQVVITPQFSNDLKTLIAYPSSCNIHFVDIKLPDYSILLDSFKKEHNARLDFIKNIFKIK